ncbi:MAG: hypothetical protein R2873_20645 [Caldilineaceae bacterium]
MAEAMGEGPRRLRPTRMTSGLAECVEEGAAIGWDRRFDPAWKVDPASAHPPRHWHGCLHARHRHRRAGHGRPASNSTTTARSTCSWAQPTWAPAPTPSWRRLPPRRWACRWTRWSFTAATPISPPSTPAPTPAAPPTFRAAR